MHAWDEYMYAPGAQAALWKVELAKLDGHASTPLDPHASNGSADRHVRAWHSAGSPESLDPWALSPARQARPAKARRTRLREQVAYVMLFSNFARESGPRRLAELLQRRTS